MLLWQLPDGILRFIPQKRMLDGEIENSANEIVHAATEQEIEHFRKAYGDGYIDLLNYHTISRQLKLWILLKRPRSYHCLRVE